MSWEKLKGILCKIWDNHDFLLTDKICIKTDEQRQELADAIEKRWATNSDEVLAYILAIYHDAPFKSESIKFKHLRTAQVLLLWGKGAMHGTDFT